MFTGIIEAIGQVKEVKIQKGNINLKISSPISSELSIDQSVSHNGICLTVTAVHGHSHEVTAVKETIEKSNIGHLKVGDEINLERCLKLSDRLDGHLVQGHVDTVAYCCEKSNASGSWNFRFTYPKEFNNLIVSKGSISINGVSLTVVNPQNGEFGVAIIPYTYDNTTFRGIEKGSAVNIEFDIIGKYILGTKKKWAKQMLA